MGRMKDMNYKKKVLRYIKEEKAEGLFDFKGDDLPTKAFKKAYDLTHEILKTRFENDLKLYNHDKERAYDHFTAKKNLDYLRLYIEEFLLLDKKEKKMTFYLDVRKYMRILLNELYVEIKHAKKERP